jgi:hypothetical protein
LTGVELGLGQCHRYLAAHGKLFTDFIFGDGVMQSVLLHKVFDGQTVGLTGTDSRSETRQRSDASGDCGADYWVNFFVFDEYGACWVLWFDALPRAGREVRCGGFHLAPVDRHGSLPKVGYPQRAVVEYLNYVVDDVQGRFTRFALICELNRGGGCPEFRGTSVAVR